MFVVKATNGNTHLGGEDLDNKLLEFCIADFKNKSGIDISGDKNKRALRRLRTQCEKAKCSLSFVFSVDIECESLAEGKDYSILMTRAKFEEICSEIF